MYAFYLDGVQLPVTPSKLSMKIKNQNKTINLISGEEVNILKVAGLTDVEFDATIPQVRYPFAIYPNGFKDAAFYIEKLEALKTSKKPFQFIVSRVSPSGTLLFDTNLTVSLEDYSIDEDAENGLDVEVSVNLKQYVPYGTKKVVIKQASSSKKTAKVTKKRASTKKTPKTYTVKKGDTLWAICKKYLGDGTKLTEIAKINKLSNPSLIHPGQVIKLG